ncbi:branched-chain amino acid ABC transporter permease [Deinococcus cellulosilyticus]|uniref:Branched-chain amino acid ABC transporter permease n=1 Tax=Deinococcus cellulosilyticus (strain DSM 18568 / NBRC 106333 / KACC 11606 / 5516J-15) TaxID=1223518 RepID=A0A511N5J9_DEIC1|nr:branched-chain amino acid ABC transporter permease [Deinococcus cellulosilyticus]GEM48149.1 branched-chain amino acid ABC transporter permease [Deinococcus cellulosilyticus NBRC 106333 = KACC 11606]
MSDLQIWQQIILQGLILGVVYAIIALGYTMVYGVLQLINFAHSEVFATGAVVGYQVLSLLSGTEMNGYVKIIIALLVAMLISGGLNILIERLAYRPLRGAPKLVPLITAIGVSFLLQDSLRLFINIKEKTDRLSYPSVLGSEKIMGLTPTELLLIIVGAIMLIGLNFLVNRTKLGTAIRAVAQDGQTARLMGINTNNIISLTFFIGGALGGVAGVLWGVKFTQVDGYIGIIPGIKAFTAAVLGGIGSIPGAVVGGLVLGFLENLIGAISVFGIKMSFTDNAFLKGIGSVLMNIGAEWKDVGAFMALIVILIFKPAGLLGKATTEKV